MSRKIEVLNGLLAHVAFIISLILDNFRRDSQGLVHGVYLAGSAIFVVSALFYFARNPHSFFFLPHVQHQCSQPVGRLRRIVVFVISWLYVAGWSIGWLLFSQEFPRAVASYSFLFGVVTTILISKWLWIK